MSADKRLSNRLINRISADNLLKIFRYRIGSALAGNFQGADMLFLLACEMGHCRAGHALWKTVIRFFLGEQGPAKGFMAGGIFNAILSPTTLISGAVDAQIFVYLSPNKYRSVA